MVGKIWTNMDRSCDQGFVKTYGTWIGMIANVSS